MSLDFLLKSFSEEDTKPKRKAKPKEEVSLAGVLQRQRLRLNRQQKPYPQSQSFSPSTITYNLCARAKIAHLAGKVTMYNEIPTPKLRFRFDLGHAIHDIIQNYYWDCNMLEGDFECNKCGKKFYARSPNECECGAKKSSLRFKEVVLKNAEYRVSGRCDGFVWVETGKHTEEKHLQDIKSIQNRMPSMPEQAWCFEDLDERGPKPDHIVQLTLYMWMSEVRKGDLLYVSTNSQQIKSFSIVYDYSVIEPYLQEIARIIELSEKLKAGEEVILPPPCSKKDCACEEIAG
jgi:hypothetical protein